MSKFADEAMNLADAMADKACAGSLAGFVHVEREALRAHLTAREALLDRMAEALGRFVRPGREFGYDDDITKALSVLSDYEESKQ